MKLITERDVIRNVAKQWGYQYPQNRLLQSGSNSGDIYNKLLALDKETATKGDVAEIIGNDGWVKINCDECGVPVDAVVRVGENTYNDSGSCLCKECLENAFNLIC